jgi:hypothetical protein
MKATVSMGVHGPAVRGSRESEFYVDVLSYLERTGLPYLVGGTFAYSWYSQVTRSTKDVDVFMRREDVVRALQLFQASGYRADLSFPHWLGKVRCGKRFVDLIFASGNGIARVDDLWFEHAVPAMVLGRAAQLCPPEELIWSKAFVQERERFDGADVLHLFRELGSTLDWERLLRRFGDHWRVLFSHITLFGFVYPDRRAQIPPWVVATLMRRLAHDEPERHNRTCYGPLLSREQYLWDIEHSGYDDARLEPQGPMTQAEIDVWTGAICDVNTHDG